MAGKNCPTEQKRKVTRREKTSGEKKVETGRKGPLGEKHSARAIKSENLGPRRRKSPKDEGKKRTAPNLLKRKNRKGQGEKKTKNQGKQNRTNFPP